MSETAPIDRTTPPRAARRFGLVAVLVGLALLIGIALMVYASRNSAGWFARPAEPGPAPAQPLVPPQPAAPAAVDTATLAIREANLAAQLAGLEARVATITADTAAAGAQAGRAEAILVAFAARRALDRGVALGYLEEQLRLRFGAVQPRATLVVLRAARQPVTIEDLRQGLDANAALLTSGGDDWFASVRQGLRALVVLHRAGTPSPLPADRLARVRRLLDAGQVEAALAEAARLPGAEKATNWTAAARRYVDAHQALDTIEGAAILGSAITR